MFLSMIGILDATSSDMLVFVQHGSLSPARAKSRVMALMSPGLGSRIDPRSHSKPPPVQRVDSSSTLCHLERGSLMFVAVVPNRRTGNVSFVFDFLAQVADLVRLFTGDHVLCPNSIRANRVLVHEVLFELVDTGFPQLIDRDVLLNCMTQVPMRARRRVAAGSEEHSKVGLHRMSLRTSDPGCGGAPKQSCSLDASLHLRRLSHIAGEEIMVEVVEKVNSQVAKNGQPISCEVTGCVMVRCHLSRVPTCCVGINDSAHPSRKAATSTSPPVEGPWRGFVPGPGAGGVVLQDFQFHPCVDLNAYLTDRSIVFVPPGSEFELMTYRVTSEVRLPFQVVSEIVERGRIIEFSIRIRAAFSDRTEAQNVILLIPCPSDSVRALLSTASSGNVKLDMKSSTISWRLRRLAGQSQNTLFAKVERAVSGDLKNTPWKRPPIVLEFEQVPCFTATGFSIRFFKIFPTRQLRPLEPVKHPVVKWIRYTAKGGVCHFRL